MENLNILLDFILIGASIWMIYTVRKLGMGGVIGSTLNSITIGAIVLGIAHLLETILIEVVEMDVVTVEFIHRSVVLVGFVLLIIGFRQMRNLDFG